MAIRLHLHTFVSALALLAFAAALDARAMPTPATHLDTPTCDPLVVPGMVDELGMISVFPANEVIDANSSTVWLPVCPATKLGFGVIDYQVTMQNQSGLPFTDLWYVAEPQNTTFTNVDGTVNGAIAFRIDTVGANTPLQSESMLPNGIFEPGEIWVFVVQDFANSAGLPAHMFSAIGVPAAPGLEAASIIAAPVPEPGTLALLGAGVAALAALRRRAARS